MEKKPVNIIIFGGTGDLMKRKLIPAFIYLFEKKILSDESLIVGIARREFNSDSYKEFLAEGTNSSIKESIKQLPIIYFQHNFEKSSELKGLKWCIESLGKQENNILYYLATPYTFFPDIVNSLQISKLHSKSGFTRVVFEKPFGSNLESSNNLNKEISRVFSEDQIYRIDHYLAKETVKNITALKISNPFFEKILTNELVNSIELIVDEELGVQNRLDSYDGVGALKDMIQSHMLQVISLLLMDAPDNISSDSIHNNKIAVLKCLHPLTAENHLLGQYKSYIDEAKGYSIKSSNTETFTRLILQCKNKRWEGVNITLRTGKKLVKKYGQILVYFKQANKNIEKNNLIIDIYPKQDIKFVLNTRKPGSENLVEPVQFEFCPESRFGPNTIDEYAALLEDAIYGDKTLFTRFDELEESWKIVERVLAMRDSIKFIIYNDGSDPEIR